MQAIKSFNNQIKRIALCWACVLLIGATVLLAGCTRVAENNEAHEALCEQFLDAVLAEDADAAFALYDEAKGLDREYFASRFREICLMFDNAETYELRQVGWNMRAQNGTTTYQTTFEVRTDDGGFYTVQLLTADGVEGIYDIFLRNNGNFEEEAARFSTLNIILKVLSALFFVGTVVLMVDCFRSRIRHRVLWVILMMLGLAFTFTIGDGSANLHFTLGLLITVMGVKTNAAALTVGITFYLPIGAIVYLFRRGHMRRVAEAEARLQASFEVPRAPAKPTPPSDPAQNENGNGDGNEDDLFQ